MAIAEGFARDQLLLRAHALTYLTLLSIVPLLALAVSLFDLVGGTAPVAEFLVEQFAAGAPEAGERILEFVEDLQFGALGTVGGTLLILTTVLAVGNIEQALNAIWGVTQQRPWLRRIPDYLAVVLISPLLLGTALSFAATLQSYWLMERLRQLPGFAGLQRLALGLVPMLLIFLGLAFLYWFMPNTKVRKRSALLGAFVAAVLFVVAQRLYVGLSIGAASYNAMFGGFAALPLLMVWVYVSWAITLLGAEVAYAHQTLALYRREVRGTQAGPAARETVGLAVALVVARAFSEGAPPWDESGLSDHLDVPLRTVREVTSALERAGLLVRIEHAEREGVFQLGRAADRVRVEDVVEALRGPRDARIAPPDVAARVDAVLAEIDAADDHVTSRTLAELVAGESSVDRPRAKP